MTAVTLTRTQQAALTHFDEHDRLYAYNGVSVATVRVLERNGLVTVDWREPVRVYGSLGRMGGRARGRWVADWVATLTNTGRAMRDDTKEQD